MFIVYFEPVYFRGRPDLYIHYFYKMIEKLGYKNLYFLTNADFFKNVEMWEKENYWNLSEYSQKFHGFIYPDNMILDKCAKSIIPSEIFNDLLNQIKENYLDGEKFLLTKIYEPLKNYFDIEIENILSNYKIEGIITVKNCPSLKVVAKKYNLPLIHYEIGGLRPFDYQFLMYFDYKGVNGETSSDELFEVFLEQYGEQPVNLLTNNEILELFSRNNFDYLKYQNMNPEYKIGAALQVYDDSNLIAFSNGYNSEKLLDEILNNFSKQDVLIRNHPTTKGDKLLSFENIDYSCCAADFIHRCEKIVTINSSVALEAALYGKQVYIYGDSPYKMLSEDLSTLANEDNKIKNNLLRKMKLNFLIFVYMVPYELFFNIDYLRYRLTNPSLIEIFNYHVDYYKKIKQDMLLNKIKEIENLKAENYQLREQLNDVISREVVIVDLISQIRLQLRKTIISKFVSSMKKYYILFKVII